ncbi:hypothetical protein [Rhodococcus opacus]|uniref:N-terminal of MaoC-like dehydratase domain-containing protein n=1 Tax=Rhodococcus opacus (strain B4) TaxID=632772 RepID=C1BB58_RHOOB|nr:hypothetical protein [Rhodococcus opacus]BAH52911.1 hypothetical protein ROP_46640 [Rhodococcus opacus B4]
MTTAVKELDPGLIGRQLPGDTTTISRHQSAITDHALHAAADRDSGESAHSIWFLVIALRGMGISVDELCALADKRDTDTLLFGTCGIDQIQPLAVGHTYRTTASIDSIDRRTTRDGSILDSLTVTVTLFDTAAPTDPVGAVTSVYLFKRGQN